MSVFLQRAVAVRKMFWRPFAAWPKKMFPLPFSPRIIDDERRRVGAAVKKSVVATDFFSFNGKGIAQLRFLLT